MTLSLDETMPTLLIILDTVIILLCLLFGRPLKKLCIIALWCNGVALAVTLIFLGSILYAMHTSSEAGLVLFFALAIQIPPLVALAALAAIYRWRMRPAPSDRPTVTEVPHH